jgi:hypothetical protein
VCLRGLKSLLDATIESIMMQRSHRTRPCLELSNCRESSALQAFPGTSQPIQTGQVSVQLRPQDRMQFFT